MLSSGVITITTDFGHKGPFVGVMKGVIAQRFPEAKVIDLTHDIPAQWPPEAGFWVSRSYSYFPRGTVHLAIVDPGVGTERDILLVEHDHHYFMAPDNGLLGRMLDEAEDAAVFRLDMDALERLDIQTPSKTFHGRDIFAPAAAHLSCGADPSEFGPAVDDLIRLEVPRAKVFSDGIRGEVIHVDSFGNLITNVPVRLLEEIGGGEHAIIEVSGRQVSGVTRSYMEAERGGLVAVIGSTGLLEIAIRDGDAHRKLGVGRGDPVLVGPGT